MFEGLFGDEDDAFSQSFAMGDALTEVNGKRFPAPSAPRRPCGLCGIQNQGSTCYLNSLLQTLLYTPEFRESLFQIGSDELGELSEKDNPQAKVRVIPIQLQRLFAQLLLLDQYTVSTTDLTDSFGWTNNEELQQHDVQELNRILFSAIDNSLVGTSGQHLISKLYHGSIVNQIICQQCGKISERQEDFLDLTLAVCGYKGLEDVLYSCYQEMELLSGSNQYRCEKCNKLVNAKKGARLRTLPPILTLSLLRFSYDFVKCERYKETGKFTFPLEVDMSPYCENTLPAESTEYELFSVVIHKGSGYGGHYHAFIRDVDTLGKWNSPEDEPIHIASDPSSGKIDYIELGKPDEVLSAILVQEGGPHCNLTIDKLCQNLIKHTGVTWNKRFKKHYGPIQKFLKKHDETFNFSPTTNSVSLKHTDKKSISLATVTMETSCEKKLQENEQLAAEETFDESRRDSKKSSKYKREPSPPPLDGHAWYDFNDSRVFPIKDKDIQNSTREKKVHICCFIEKIFKEAK
ncbi:ubiquitin carboxyl-terminal hydrolase 40-like [Saccoglossus kowalevskii]|uniref:Ubiquitin carboxyl-terminal hydrolase n=1 Tax=Saccoglossus kowalevskii TaxID=10224 RepID=A0ABM0MHW9_SACKO|nr:PREDICTED: ubiquitin carboxyl-terminal hydrolase 40-like [Saccoglossus kowalevskii]